MTLTFDLRPKIILSSCWICLPSLMKMHWLNMTAKCNEDAHNGLVSFVSTRSKAGWLVGWLVVVLRHIQQYFSYIVTGKLSNFQILTCCRAPNATDSLGSLACRAYPDTGTGTSEDAFNLLAIRGPTCGEGMPGIEPGSSDPQSSPLPLRHRGGPQDQNVAHGRTYTLVEPHQRYSITTRCAG